jgi:outer membrane lipoprotein SlyB
VDSKRLPHDGPVPVLAGDREHSKESTMQMTKISTLVSVAALAALTACSSEPTRNDRMPGVSSSMETQTSQYGRVTSIETTDRKKVSGRLLGAVLGAAIGSQVGSGTGKAAAVGVGAVGGAIAGNQVDQRRADDVYRVTVRFDDGSTRQFDFERVDDLRIGDRVKWENGEIYRA